MEGVARYSVKLSCSSGSLSPFLGSLMRVQLCAPKALAGVWEQMENEHCSLR